MSEQKLRKFRLICKNNYIKRHPLNESLLNYLEDGCFVGIVSNSTGSLCTSDIALIREDEFQFFHEETISNDNETPSNEVSATFSDEMIHCIKEDCHTVNGSLCFYKEGVVFLWNEDEYFIESVEDYNKVINSIKVLNSFKK